MALSPPTLAFAALCLLPGCYQGALAQQGDDESSPGAGSTAAEGSSSAGDDTGDGVPREVVPEPLHRLNRLEYNNTVRDLLGTIGLKSRYTMPARCAASRPRPAWQNTSRTARHVRGLCWHHTRRSWPATNCIAKKVWPSSRRPASNTWTTFG